MKINTKILILPFLNILMFIILSSFGQMFFMKIGLSFIFALIFLVVYLIKAKKLPKQINISFLLLVVYCLVQSVIAKDIYYCIISIGTVASFSLICDLKLDEKEWSITCLLTSIFSTIVLILYNMKIVLVNWNPNSLGGFCMLGMLMSIISFNYEKNNKKKIILLLFMLYQIAQLYFTECRTATLIFIVAFVATLFFKNLINNKKRKLFCIFFIICASFTLIATQYVKISKLEFIEEISDVSKELFGKGTLFSDRDIIWERCEQIIGEDWLLGKGESLYRYFYSHNMYYSICYSYGLIGYLLYCIFTFNNCYYVIKKNKNSTIAIIAVVIFPTIMLGQITENIMFTSDSNIFMAYIFLSIGLANTLKERKESEENNSIYPYI